jgi:hypothetical protein
MLTRLNLARALSALGIISVLLLFGVSCGSSGATTDVSKGVSTDYYVEGFVTCDHNDDGDVNDQEDHDINGVPVKFRCGDNMSSWTAWDTTWTYTYDGRDGYYHVKMNDGYYTQVKLGVPVFFHYSHWVPWPMEARWDYYDQPWTAPPPDGACYPLRFMGTDCAP